MLPDHSINMRGSLMNFKSPKIMGIINVTPDSFYEGSRKVQLDEILSQANNMLVDGADFLDIGGYSSRPGAADIPVEEELKRVIEPIKTIRSSFPEAKISVDTFRAKVADKAVDAGADIVNDIAAGHLDDEMLQVVGQLKVPYVAMHMKGNPQNMRSLATYDDLLLEVIRYFSEVLEKTNKLGINDVLIDPGFGFAKTVGHNFELLNKLELLSALEKPLLVGLSRKSMITKTLDINVNQSLNGTTVLNTLAILKGASVLRVHDIKEAKQIVNLLNKTNQY